MADALSRNLKISEDKEENQISLLILGVNYVTGNYQKYPEKSVINRIREETSRYHIAIIGKIHHQWLASGLKENS